jgi:DNA repair ATPase RecN
LSLKKTTHETACKVGHVAAEAATTRKELKAAGEKVEQMWEALRQQTDRYRRDIQSTLDEAIGRYQSLHRQMNELASTATSHDELEQLRRTHRHETDQIVAEIARRGQEFKQLLEEAWLLKQN